jgi:hypothetical protein
MFLNPFNTEEAGPLRQRRKWRNPRRNAYAELDAHFHAHIGASYEAHFAANFNATRSQATAANNRAASMASSI